MSTKDDPMLARLAELDERFCRLEQQMMDPQTASVPSLLIPLRKEQSKLRHIVSQYRQYLKLAETADQAQQILSDETAEADLKAMADQEIEELSVKMTQLLDGIKDRLVMAEDEAIDSVILEIRAGTGGEEAALFAKDLYQMYTRYADKRGWKLELLDFSTTDKGGFREVIANVKGSGVWLELGYEGGGHRVQRVPETETQGRIHTSAATVAVLPEAEEVDINIKSEDVRENVSCAGGPGGQNVNKVASAIRLEHLPTGIVVSMRDERSQHKNRAKAWKILRSRVYEHYRSLAHAERDSKRKTMIGSGDRSQRIRTYNFPQNRVTDHRINVSLYNLEKIMMGEMDELVAALKEYDRRQRLANFQL